MVALLINSFHAMSLSGDASPMYSMFDQYSGSPGIFIHRTLERRGTGPVSRVLVACSIDSQCLYAYSIWLPGMFCSKDTRSWGQENAIKNNRKTAMARLVRSLVMHEKITPPLLHEGEAVW